MIYVCPFVTEFILIMRTDCMKLKNPKQCSFDHFFREKKTIFFFALKEIPQFILQFHFSFMILPSHALGLTHFGNH